MTPSTKHNLRNQITFAQALGQALKPYGIRNSNTRAKNIIQMLEADFHANKMFNNIIASQKRDNTFDLFWKIKKYPVHQKKAATYEPTEELQQVLQEAKRIKLQTLRTSDCADFTIPIDAVHPQQVRDFALIETNSHSRNGDLYNITNKVKDDQIRVYTTFNSLSGDTRKKTNYCNEYDMSTAAQTFALEFIKMHNLGVESFQGTTYYINNKTEVREELAQEIKPFFKLDITSSKSMHDQLLDEAKMILTSTYYGATLYGVLNDYWDCKGPIFTTLRAEAQKIRKVLYNNLDKINDDAFQDYMQMRVLTRKTKPVTKNKGKANEITVNQKKDKTGVMLHSFLEYHERKVKDILDRDDEGQDVHDAVYFNKIPTDILDRLDEIKKKFNITVERG